MKFGNRLKTTAALGDGNGSSPGLGSSLAARKAGVAESARKSIGLFQFPRSDDPLAAALSSQRFPRPWRKAALAAQRNRCKQEGSHSWAEAAEQGETRRGFLDSAFHLFFTASCRPTARGASHESCGPMFQFLDSLDGGRSASTFLVCEAVTGIHHAARAGPANDVASCKGERVAGVCWAQAARVAPGMQLHPTAFAQATGLASSWAGSGIDETGSRGWRPPAGVAPGASDVGAWAATSSPPFGGHLLRFSGKQG